MHVVGCTNTNLMFGLVSCMIFMMLRSSSSSSSSIFYFFSFGANNAVVNVGSNKTNVWVRVGTLWGQCMVSVHVVYQTSCSLARLFANSRENSKFGGAFASLLSCSPIHVLLNTFACFFFKRRKSFLKTKSWQIWIEDK